MICSFMSNKYYNYNTISLVIIKIIDKKNYDKLLSKGGSVKDNYDKLGFHGQKILGTADLKYI